MNRLMANVVAGVVAAGIAGCGSGESAPATDAGASAGPVGPSVDSSVSSPESAAPGADPVTTVPRIGVIYLRAWAATDVPTMIAASVPDSPAGNFAQYWNDAYRAGRLDAGPGVVTVRPRSVGVRFGSDGYRFTGAQTGPGGRLVTWTSDPGGPLAGRVVAGPPTTVRVGQVRVTGRYQYVNGDGDLRVSLRVVADREDDLAAVRYRPGARTATLGSQGQTGVITVKPGVNWAIASVESGRPGGELLLRTYDTDGTTTGRGTLQLPAP